MGYRRIDLPGVQDEIQQVCPIAQERLVVFGYSGGYAVYIMDQKKGAVADSFMGYSPVMSPNQHWVIFREFYAYHTEFVVGEQYLLYDLSGSAASNRHGLTPYTSGIPGRSVYPTTPGSAPVDRRDVPESQGHRFRSTSFYWSRDSGFVAFADSVQGTFSLVLSSVAADKITTYVHPVSSSDVCSGDPPAVSDTSDLTLKHAEISSVGSSPVIVAQFVSGGRHCTPKEITLGLADSKLAETEVYEPRQRKAATPIKRP